MIINSNKRLFDKLYIFNDAMAPSLIVATFGSLFIDLFTYQNFLGNLIGLSSSHLFVFSLVSISIKLLNKIYKKSIINSQFNLILELNSLILPFLLVISFFLYQLESENFANYVFSEYHIHLIVLSKIILLSLVLLLYKTVNMKLLKRITVTFFKNKKIIFEKKMFFIIAVFFVTYNILLGFQRLVPWYVRTVKHTGLSFEEKNRVLFGNLYYQYNLINEFTEEDSVIAVAPQLFDGMIGNIGFSRYFVYPRFLFHPDDGERSLQDADYVIVSSNLNSLEGNNFTNWPSVSFEIDKGVSINKITNEITEVNDSFYNELSTNFNEKVSILKVKK